ncbi:peptidase M41 family protein [Mycobacterium xenopi 4042]|uniref:Peptidase M41 family protein n=1 Tax=Mycobacterium xenopi 4042 TaxID=1299334 RepID=X7ZWN4_MYCXE|nr:peptidase M41 family protein [Mycobacterium xenopi 4042]
MARDIDEEIRKLIEAAHTEAWEILTEYRDVLDTLAGELLEKETLHRPELEAIFADVEKRPRLTMFDDFGAASPRTSRRSRLPASWPKSAVSRGRRRCPNPRSKRRSHEPAPRRRRPSASETPTAPTVHRQPRGGRRPGCSTAAPHSARLRRPAGWRAPGGRRSSRITGIRRRRRRPSRRTGHHHRRTIRVSPTRRVRRR